MLTRRQFLQALALLPFLPSVVSDIMKGTPPKSLSNGRSWGYPLSFPAYFPIEQETNTSTSNPVHKQYLPIVIRHG